jgi:hypothetical protein
LCQDGGKRPGAVHRGVGKGGYGHRVVDTCITHIASLVKRGFGYLGALRARRTVDVLDGSEGFLSMEDEQ